MKIDRFNSRFFNANCYVITDNNKSIVIDPCVPYSNLSKALDGNEVLGVFLTHGHFDHISNLDEFLNNHNVLIHCHLNAREKLEDENKNYSTIAKKSMVFKYEDSKFSFLREGDFTIGPFKIKVLETPGHTDCSLCYIIEDNMFSGDTLFKGSVGRCDLYSGNTYKMMQSIDKLKRLNPDMKVLPGHDGVTSIKIEKLTNRYFI
ncbi:MAG: MBL fold metallo-hydrolase [Bacilli bacterium]